MRPTHEVFKEYIPQYGSWNDINLPHVVSVVDKFQSQGYTASIRQIFYQLVSHHGLSNTQDSYDKVQDLLKYARLGGYVSFSAIVDRGREIEGDHRGQGKNETVEEGVLACVEEAKNAADYYTLDPWREMRYLPIVLVEKDALSGVLSPLCTRYGVPFISTHGNPSITLLKDLAGIINKRCVGGSNRECYLLHLTDHDPAGLYSMVTQITGKNGDDSVLEMCCKYEESWKYRRIGLSMDHVVTYGLPPNPLKEHSNAAQYRREHGEESWELDALDSEVLVKIVSDELDKFHNEAVWERVLSQETEVKERFEELISEALR